MGGSRTRSRGRLTFLAPLVAGPTMPARMADPLGMPVDCACCRVAGRPLGCFNAARSGAVKRAKEETQEEIHGSTDRGRRGL
jgi:hypothetical protein